MFIISENIKNKIAETLVSLSQKKPINKITVKELSEECGVSRQTFYYYYQDIVDVLEWHIETKIASNVKRCMAIENDHDAIIDFIVGVLGIKPFLRHISDSRLRDETM